MPLFTINVAVYNQLDNLKLILKALEMQTFKDFEIIVCDDGSNDGTMEFVNQDENDRVRYFWQNKKGFRLAKSKNNGVRATKGKYFVSLEGDVIPHFKLLEEYKRWVKPKRVIYGVRHEIEWLPEEIDFEQLDRCVTLRDYRLAALKELPIHNRPWRLCSGCNFLIPTDTLKDIGGWNENYTHYGVDDYEVCLRLAMAGCDFMALPEAYGYHLKHGIRESRDENWRILEKLEEEYENSSRIR
jgi:GT2 family glycosyltransferase